MRSLLLHVAAAALAGDFNGDGRGDAAAYLAWRKGFGSIYFQSDGLARELRRHLADSHAVPEPAAGILLLSWALAWIGFRRRGC